MTKKSTVWEDFEEATQENYENWRAKKIKLFIIGLIIAGIGMWLTIEGIFTFPTEDVWKFPIGFFVTVLGLFVTLETQNWTYRKHLSNKRRKARKARKAR